MIKKILLVTIMPLVLAACGDKGSCESYDDVYGIHFGCNQNYVKTITGANLISEVKSSGASTYEVDHYYVAPFSSGSSATIKIYDDKIFIVMLAKKYRGEQSKANIPADIKEILNDIESKWGEIKGKDLVLKASQEDLSNVEYKTFDAISADIESPNSKHVGKIHLEFSVDTYNNPVFSASFIGK